MAKSTTTSAGTPPKRRTKKQPKASTLYGYLRNYCKTNDIGEDQSIGVVMQQLRDSIVDESQDE
jgi:hypothetical protein